jgi:hypothetical protein
MEMTKKIMVSITTASTYDDFMENYGTECLKNIREFKKIFPFFKTMTGPECDRLEKMIAKYDTEVQRQSDHWTDGRRLTINEMANLGIEIQNRHGTEPRMVAQCLEDIVGFAKMALNKRKTTKASSENFKYTDELSDYDLATASAMTLAFEHTLRNFDPAGVALAYNMKQTKTRLSKEAIAGKIQSHKDWIKRRKDKIKMLEMAKKAASMKPEKVQKLSQRITKQGERIAKHQDAIKYYSMLSKIKPPKVKVNPANRGK